MARRRKASAEGNKQTVESSPSFESIPFFEVNTESTEAVETTPSEPPVVAEVASEAIGMIEVTGFEPEIASEPIETVVVSSFEPSSEDTHSNSEAQITFDPIEEGISLPEDPLSHEAPSEEEQTLQVVSLSEEALTEEALTEEEKVPELGEIAVPEAFSVAPEELAPKEPEEPPSEGSTPKEGATTSWSSQEAVWTEGPTSSISNDGSDLTFLLEENAQLTGDVQRLRVQNDSLRWQLSQLQGEQERETRQLNLEISRLSLELASQNNEYDSRVAELLTAHSESYMALRIECDQRIAKVTEDLSKLSLWQIDQGSKRSVVVGSDAQDAIRRLIASGVDVKKQPITSVRTFNEKFII